MVKKFCVLFLLCLLLCVTLAEQSPSGALVLDTAADDETINWVDFDVSYKALEDTMNMDITTYEQDLHISWLESLAYLAARYGGDFSQYTSADLTALVEKRLSGSSMEELTSGMGYYDYYYRAYSAVIGNFLGLQEDGTYGLIACSPVAAGYWYTDSDDFGNGRSYGFARKHLGHDLFCSTGTPVMAVEGGKVEALGWNQYGGWRIGIRSNDGYRYYYYAHLRKDSPYIDGLQIGDTIEAGQVIGYTGQTGYSIKENVNNISVPHLHFGMQLIFDESQKECNGEIWIDTYALVQLLARHRASAEDAQTAAAVSQISAAEGDTRQVPILMYHGLTEKTSQVNDYFILADTFAADMKFLRENGYTAVTINELIDFVYDKTGKATLPEKPVIITFDDGYCNNYRLATPILEQYGMKGVISVIGSACAEASDAEYRAEDYCNVTWDQIGEMSASGLWEVQNHTWNLHQLKNGRKGAGKIAGESQAQYEQMLTDDLTQLQAKLKEATGTVPTAFTWPFGAYTEEGEALLKSLGFKATLSCRNGLNAITRGDTDSLYLLRRGLRTPDSNLEKLLAGEE